LVAAHVESEGRIAASAGVGVGSVGRAVGDVLTSAKPRLGVETCIADSASVGAADVRRAVWTEGNEAKPTHCVVTSITKYAVVGVWSENDAANNRLGRALS
jgi:hypothetical protein